MQIKFGEKVQEFSEAVSVLEAIKAFDRDVLKKTIAAIGETKSRLSARSNW